MIQCYGREEWHHPKCVEISEFAIRQNDSKSFKCWWCDPYTMFLNKYENVGNGLCAVLVSMEVDDGNADDEDDQAIEQPQHSDNDENIVE